MKYVLVNEDGRICRCKKCGTPLSTWHTRDGLGMSHGGTFCGTCDPGAEKSIASESQFFANGPTPTNQEVIQ